MAGISKITFNGQTLIDISRDTVTEDKMTLNTTAHSADGSPITGTFDINEKIGFYVDDNGLCYLYYRG